MKVKKKMNEASDAAPLALQAPHLARRKMSGHLNLDRLPLSYIQLDAPQQRAHLIV
jgi:hypothetical protein